MGERAVSGTEPAVSGTERAVFGQDDLAAIAERLGRYLGRHLGTSLAEVVFRSGRIDAVWGVRTGDGREVVIKAHRPPVDRPARVVAARAMRLLAAAGFPCPIPISGPDRFDGLTLTAETLLSAGQAADPRRPAIRRAVAGGLAGHVRLLSREPELVEAAGRGPAWCRYQDGPWPVPHDPIFDFRRTPEGFAWLDAFAADAAGRLNAGREVAGAVVAGHADWYGGNLRFDGERLVAAFDWDLVADAEPVIAGMSAGSWTASSTSGGGLPAPAEVTAFLTDYDTFRSRPFTAAEQRVAAAAAGWVLAYNARCELSLSPAGPPSPSTLDLLREHATDYLNLSW